MNVALDDISEDFDEVDTRLNSIDTDLANVESTLVTHEATLNSHETEIANLQTTKADEDDLKNHINDTDNPHNVTKEQIGLGNVINVQQVDINGDTMKGMLNLYSYTERINTFTDADTTLTPPEYNVFVLTLTTNTARTININNTGLVPGRAHSFTLVIRQWASPASITFKNGVPYEFGYNQLDQLNFYQTALRLPQNPPSDGYLILWKTKNVGVVELTVEQFNRVIEEGEAHKLEKQNASWN